MSKCDYNNNIHLNKPSLQYDSKRLNMILHINTKRIGDMPSGILLLLGILWLLDDLQRKSEWMAMGFLSI